MISDVCVIKDIDRGKIPSFEPVEYDGYDEFWSLWSLENPCQRNNNRLRYHLGHLLMAKKMKSLLNDNKQVKAIICDFQKGTGRWDATQESYLKTTREALSIFLNDQIDIKAAIPIKSTCMSEYVEAIKKSATKDTYDRIAKRIQSLLDPIKNAYKSLSRNYENLYYLYKYRDISIPGLLFVPKKLDSIYKSFPYKEIPPYVFFASLYALYQSEERSETDFINSFWVKTGFPLLACVQNLDGEKRREICIVEGKRSAYVWLFLDYLRYMYKSIYPEDKADIDWPNVVYLDSLSAIHGASYMESSFPSEAIFIDSSKKETKKKLANIPEPVRREYSARCLGTGMCGNHRIWEDTFLGYWHQHNASLSRLIPKKSLWYTCFFVLSPFINVNPWIGAAWKAVKRLLDHDSAK